MMATERERMAQIACDAMNALGNSLSALEDIKKRGKWEGMQDVALREARASLKPSQELYDYFAHPAKAEEQQEKIDV
jgi:hypothetical protein